MKMRVFVVVMMLSAWASAGIVIGVAGHNDSTCLPWSCLNINTGNYEQTYNSTAFPGAMTISKILFFDTVYYDGPNQGVGQFSGSVYLAVTSQAIPDGTIPGGAVLFATGSMNGQNWPFGKTLDINGTPFYYDPSLGNLELILVPSAITGGPLSGVYTYFDAGYNNPFSFWCLGCGSNPGYGLVTGFNTGGPTTPEPGSMVLLGTGIVGLAGRLRRKFMR